MSFANKYNKGGKFDLNVKAFTDYYSLEKLYTENGKDAVYKLGAVYINKKSKFGPAPTFAVVDSKFTCGGYFVNIPAYMLEQANEILTDAEAIAEINGGKVGFVIETYEAGKYGNKVCYGVRFTDL